MQNPEKQKQKIGNKLKAGCKEKQQPITHFLSEQATLFKARKELRNTKPKKKIKDMRKEKENNQV